MPKISVIIPVYNVEKYIERCARSLFEQTLDDIEYIFVDDCTPDNSIDIIQSVLQEYPDRQAQITFIKHEKNKGLTAARNSGLEVAKGDYIAHCDSDDWVDINMYKTLYDEAIKNYSDIVYSDINIVFRDYQERFHSIAYTPNKKELISAYISSKWTSLVNMIVHKSIYKEYGLKLPTHICYCEDFWLSIRFFYYARNFAKVNQAFYYYDQTNTNSIMHNLTLHRGEDLNCYLETIDFFTSEGCIDKFEKEMSWRVLNAFHFDMFNPKKHKEIVNIYPKCHKYILSNPFYIKRQKQLMWLLTHHCRWMVLCFLALRKIIGREDII